MSWVEKAEQQLSGHTLMVRAIAALAPVVKEAIVKPGSDAFAVLQLVERVFDRIADGFDGKVTAAEAEEHIKRHIDRLAEQDATIDAKIDAKFNKGDP